MYHGMNIYGTATIGTKGQIVIPAEARADLDFKEGNKVFVIGLKDRGVIGIVPVASMDEWMQHMSEKLEHIRSSVKDNKRTADPTE